MNKTTETKPQPSASAAPRSTSEPKTVVARAEELSDEELSVALKVLRTEARRRQNELDAKKPKVGAKVRITDRNSKLFGKIGTAIIVRRSRCFVSVPDVSNPAYLRLSDVELAKES